jgi:hypothetical protein
VIAQEPAMPIRDGAVDGTVPLRLLPEGVGFPHLPLHSEQMISGQR